MTITPVFLTGCPKASYKTRDGELILGNMKQERTTHIFRPFHVKPSAHTTPKQLQTASNSFKQLQTASNSFKQLQTASNSFKQLQTASNYIKPLLGS
ncbi:hypothetical protein VR010_13890 [Actinomycetaceae bacterium L2_0104]